MRVGLVVVTYKYKTVVPDYVQNIFSVLSQHVGQLDVLFVDNLSDPIFTNDLREKCIAHSNERVSFSYISERNYVTLFLSMNLGFHILRNAHEYDVIGYSASDVWLEHPNGLQRALNDFSENIAIVSAQANWDNAPDILANKYDIDGDTSLRIEIGDVVNLHFILFSRAYLNAYDFRYPDVLRSFGTENFLSFCAAAIGKHWVISRQARLRNARINPDSRIPPKGIKGFSTVTGISLHDLISPGIPVGMGFQSFAKGAPPYNLPYYAEHNPSLYKNGICHSPEPLFRYLKSYLFLPGTEYDARFQRSKQRAYLLKL